MREILQPYIFPFQNRIINEYGEFCDVECSMRNLPLTHAYRITPGVIYGMTSEETHYLVSAHQRIEFNPFTPIARPEYIGRGMIRLKEAPALRDDRIVDLQLNEITNPDRSFAGVDWCDYIYDDESYAFATSEDDVKNTLGAPWNPCHLLRPDGKKSIEAIGISTETDLTKPSGIGLSHHLMPFLFESGKHEPHLRGHNIIGRNRDHLAFHTAGKDLIIYNRDREEVGRIPETWSYFVTASDRLVTTHDWKHSSKSTRVYTLHGELIKQAPDFNKRVDTRSSMSWCLCRAPESQLAIFNAELERTAILPRKRGRDIIGLSPDGYAFYPGMLHDGKMHFRQLGYFAPNGELINTYSVETPSRRQVRIEHEQRAREQANMLVSLDSPQRTYQIKETLYAAAIQDHPGTALSYRRVAINVEPTPRAGWYIIVPRLNAKDCCPACGTCWQSVPFTEYGTELCPTCKLAPCSEVYDYDDSLDAEYGGQFGQYRKSWLDETGWKTEDLDRIERVFRIDTSTWTR